MENTLTTLITDLLKQLTFEEINIDIQNRVDEKLYVNITTESPSLLIGAKGQTIYALEYIIKLLLKKQNTENFNFVLDVDGYREKQFEKALNITKSKIEILRTSLKEQKLPPMSAYMRRKIHLFIKSGEYSDISTESIGEEPSRSVVLIPNMP